jgi:hypothetical protein
MPALKKDAKAVHARSKPRPGPGSEGLREVSLARLAEERLLGSRGADRRHHGHRGRMEIVAEQSLLGRGQGRRDIPAAAAEGGERF